jgi:hypothetical protein
MHDAFKTVLTVALTLSILTAFGGGATAQPTAVDAGTAPADVDTAGASGLDAADLGQSTSMYNDTNDTNPCSPFRQWGVIC